MLGAKTRTRPCRSGNFLLDDRSIASYGRKEFARTAAFMPQSRPVPGITVRALVAHGRFPYLGFSRRMTAQDTAAVEQAMRRTGTLDWANRDVRALSGGERQRIAIARAMLKNAPVVILDEATAYIDPENEALVQKAISALTVGKTLIVIAHRLSTIVGADNIVVVKDGTIHAQGTHEKLLETCPLYRDMWQAHIGAKDQM